MDKALFSALTCHHSQFDADFPEEDDLRAVLERKELGNYQLCFEKFLYEP